jgi:hypothetical protein
MAKKPPEPWQPMLLDVKPARAAAEETRVEYEPVRRRPAARDEPVFTREVGEAPWQQRAREVLSRTGGVPELKWGQAWLRLLRGEGWLVDLPTSIREGFERSVRGLACRAGVVEAAFSDGVHKPHRVQLRLGAFTPAEWARIARKIVDDGSASLVREAAGRKAVPMALLEAADATGVALLPKRLAVLQATCSCGGARAPCDHVLAVHLSLARLLDEGPWHLVSVRGGSAELLEGLLARTHSGAAAVAEAAENEVDPFAPGDRSGVDWRLVAGPPPARAPLPPPDGWRSRESFDALVRRLLQPFRGAVGADEGDGR